MAQWLNENWLTIAVPLLVFLATYVVGLWLRGKINAAMERWRERTKWGGNRLVIAAVHRPFLLWVLLAGITIAIQVSALPAVAKAITVMAAGSLFVLSLGWVIIVLGERLLKMYLPRIKSAPPTTSVILNIYRIVIITITVLMVLDIWGIPTTPVLLLIAVAVVAAALAFRNAVPNLFAGFQLNASQQIKVGDYIKLETGQEGYVTEIGWNTTQIKALDGSAVIVPNSQFLQNSLVNYGHPLKKASEPFRFYSRTHLTELTGLKAKSLQELGEILRTASEPVIYFHTHHFLEQHHYLTPEPSNDFALWVTAALGDEALGERLASVNTFEFSNLAALQSRLVSIIEEHLAAGHDHRQVMPGQEFYFMKSVSIVFPSPYQASDLREFVETLRKISLGSLYFHIFESRLRLGRGLNDFSTWMQGSLDESELGEEIARLDPYTYTLEGLRSTLIRLIEKRIK
jgi:small-conductance mechanosensitive channel